MAIEYKRPQDLEPAASVPTSAAIPVGIGDEVPRATPKQIVDAGRPIASQGQALAGISNDVAMTPLTTRQAMDVGLPSLISPYVNQAETARDQAQASASLAAQYDGPRVDSVTALKADAALANTPGTYVQTRSEGFEYRIEPAVAIVWHITTAAGVKLSVSGAKGETNILAFGADPTGAVDAQPAFAAANAMGLPCYVPPGKYRINSAIPLKTCMRFYGRRGGDSANPSGSVLLQYGQKLWQGDEDLRWAAVEGFSFDRQYATPDAYTVAFSLRAHRECVFRDLYFVRYNLCTIMERLPQTATINSIDNLYSDWMIEACTHVCLTIGQDGWGTSFQGNGASTVIATGLAWPEQYNSSVTVFREASGRSYVHLTLGTDYTVTYPGGLLTVTMVTAPTVNERIHIFPSQPRADAAAGRQRRPFSNNQWSKIVCNYNFGHAWQDLRWVDAEFYSAIRFHAAADGVRCFYTNPSNDRTCEGGDFSSYTDCVMSYISGMADPATIWGWYMGPGSLQMTGTAIACDLNWVQGGVNRAINNVSRRVVALAGTVSTTSGSAVVTGTGTVFRQVLTLIGDSSDKVQIGANVYGIASIDSNTQLTLTSNVGSTGSGLSISRVNAKNANSYSFGWANLGSTEYRNFRGGAGRSEYGSSTRFAATATIAAGQTSVTVPHTLWRGPTSSDVVQLTAMSNTAIGGTDRAAWVSNITDSSAQINISATATADMNFRILLELDALN